MHAETSPDSTSLSSLFSLGTFLGLLVGYGLGFSCAVWRRARADYNKTAGSLPGMRSAKWVAWRLMMQRGAIVVIVLVVVVAWLVIAALNQEPT